MWEPGDPYRYAHLEPEEFMKKVVITVLKDEWEQLHTRIAELEGELHHDSGIPEFTKGWNAALDRVLALPTVTLGPMGTKAIPIFRIEALRGEGE